MFDISNTKIGVIGLGYVGLPLAVEFAKHLPVIGFDINKARIAELKAGKDSSLEVEPHELAEATQLTVTTDIAALDNCNFYIVTVPTPIDKHKRPDLGPCSAPATPWARRLKKATWWYTNPPSIPAAPRKTACPSSNASRV